jgi:tetratricopeptide (TPR) repeat protein
VTTKLETPDSFFVDAAQGWLGLGDVASANDELNKISPKLQNHPQVLLVRCEIATCAKQWDVALSLANTVIKTAPKERQGWIHRSFALHELKRTQEAYDQLLPAVKNFPKFWLIPYNLACYCAQLDRLPEAWDWFQKAVKLGGSEQVRTLALDDSDLQPLWRNIAKIKTADRSL